MTRLHLLVTAALTSILLCSSTAYAFQVRAVVAADTNDPAIGEAVGIDAMAMREHLERMTEAAGIGLDLTYLVGDDATATGIEEALQQLEADPNDVVLFYYTGHAVNDDGERWPRFTLDRESLSFVRVRELVNQLNARLTVIFSDCCNCPAHRNMRPDESKIEFDVEDWSPDPDKVRELLEGHAGEVRVTSSQFPEFSWIAPPQDVREEPWIGGSVWTRPLLRNLRQQVSAAGEANWENWLEQTHEEALTYAEQSWGQPQTSLRALELRQVEIDSPEEPEEGEAIVGDEMPLLFEDGGPWRQQYYVDVREEHQVLILALVSFGGDLDLYVRYGEPMESPKQADFQSNHVGDVDSIFLSRKQEERALRTGRYFLLVDNVKHAPATGTLYVQRLGHGPALSEMAGTLRPNRAVTVQVPEDENRIVQYVLDVPAAAERVRLTLREAESDIDLYVREDRPIVRLQEATWSSRSKDGDETLVLDAHSDPPLTAGTRLYVAVHNPSGVATRARLQALVQIPMSEPGEYTNRLTEESRRYGEQFAEYYNLQLERGNEVKVTMRAEAFQPSLFLVDPAGTLMPGEMRTNGAGEATLHFFTRQAGIYSIVATSEQPGASGPFHIDIQLGGPEARQVTPGVYHGYLAHTDESYERRDNRYADFYLFEAEAGQQIRVTMRSTEVDSYIFLESPEGHVWWDDDGGGGLDSLLELEAPVSGTYRLVATSYGVREVGAYRVNIEVTGEPATEPEPEPELGVRHGELTEESPRHERTETRYESFSVVFEEGQTVSIEAYSEDFPPTLILIAPNGNVATDQASGQRATLSGRIPQSGEHEVIVAASSPEETGRFRLILMVDETPYDFDNPPTLDDPHPEPAPGQRLGELTEESPVYERRNTLHHRYEVYLEEGQHLQIDLESEAFDPYLVLEFPDGGIFEDDDGGEGTNARIAGTVRDTGSFAIIVTTYASGETGPYRLTVVVDEQPYPWEEPPTPEPAPEPGVVTGELSEESPVHGERGTYYHRYPVRFEAGAVLIQLESEAFDPYLYLEDTAGQVLAQGDGEISGRVRSPGEFVIVVSTQEPEQTGAYRLHVTVDEEPYPWDEAVEPEPAPEPGVLTGELTEQSPVHEERGTYFQRYRINFEAGAIRIQLESEAFDPYLYLEDTAGRVLAQGEGEISGRVGSPSEFVVVVSTQEPGQTGAYRLRITIDDEPYSLDGVVEPELAPLTFEGELTEESEVYPRRETFADRYEIELPADMEVRIDLTSEQFDPFLYVYTPEGERLHDDDSGEGNNSRLEFTTEEAGTYTVIATSFSSGATGSYQLRVYRGVIPEPEPDPTVRGELSPASGRTEYGYGDAYFLELERGQRVQVDLKSEDFDPLLIVRRPDGVTASDRTSGEGSNARLRFRAPLEGTYEFIVTTARDGETGHYELIVEQEGEVLEELDGPHRPVPPSAALEPNSRTAVIAEGGEMVRYVVEFPERAHDVRIALENSEADFDLYLRFGEPMETRADADDAAVTFHWDEELSYSTLEPGPVYIGVYNDSGETARTTLVIEARFEGEPEPTAVEVRPVALNRPVEVHARGGGFTQLLAELPDNPGRVTVSLTGSTSDFDLFARLDEPMHAPEEAEFAAVSFAWDEELVIENLGRGELYVLVYNDGRNEGLSTVTIRAENVVAPPEPREPAPAVELEPETPSEVTLAPRTFTQFALQLDAPQPERIELRLEEAHEELELLAATRPMSGIADAEFAGADDLVVEWLTGYGETLFVGVYNHHEHEILDTTLTAVLVAPEPVEGVVDIEANTPVNVRLAAQERAQYRVRVPYPESVAHVLLHESTADFDLYTRLGEPMHSRDDATESSATFDWEEELRLYELEDSWLYILAFNDSDLEESNGTAEAGEAVLQVGFPSEAKREAIEPIESGEAQALEAEGGEFQQFVLELGPGEHQVELALRESSVDFDLYARLGEPMRRRFDATAAAESPQGNETLRLSARSGRLYVGVYNDSRLSGRTELTATVRTIGLGEEVFEFVEPGSSIPVAADAQEWVQLESHVPYGATGLRVELQDTNGDFDLYIRFGEPLERRADADHRAVTVAGDEWLEIGPDSSPPLQFGPLYILVFNDEAERHVTGTLHVTPHGVMRPEEARPLAFEEPQEFEIGGGRSIVYTLEIPEEASQLRLQLLETTASFGLHVSRRPFGNPAMSLWQAAGAGSNNMLVMSRDREPPMQPGPIYVLVHNETPYTAEGRLVAYHTTEHVDGYLDVDTTVPFTLPHRGAPFVQYGIEIPEGVSSVGLDLDAPEGVELEGFVRPGEPFRAFTAGEVVWRLGQRVVLDELEPGTTLYVLLTSNEQRAFTGYLSVEASPHEPRREPTPLEEGTHRAELTADDELLDEHHLRRYAFAGEAGQEVTIRLESLDFDAYLVVIGPDGERWENDDAEGEETTDSQLILTLPSTGTYEVHVTTFRPYATGRYRLIYRIHGEDEEAPPEEDAEEATDEEDATGEVPEEETEDF